MTFHMVGISTPSFSGSEMNSHASLQRLSAQWNQLQLDTQFSCFLLKMNASCPYAPFDLLGPDSNKSTF